MQNLYFVNCTLITGLVNTCNEFNSWNVFSTTYIPMVFRGLRGRDRMVVGFTTTPAINAYHR